VPGKSAVADNVENSKNVSTTQQVGTESSAKEEASEQLAPAPNTSRAAPSYDVEAYCAGVSAAVGGSYVIEKGCRDQERDALSKIRSRDIPTRVARYCNEVSEAVGGSYVIFNGCVDQELGAAAEL
jgi:hypothetical protein